MSMSLLWATGSVEWGPSEEACWHRQEGQTGVVIHRLID